VGRPGRVHVRAPLAGIKIFGLFIDPLFGHDAGSLVGLPGWTIISTIGRLLGTILLIVSGNCARNNKYLTLLEIVAVSSILVLAGYLYRDRLLELLRKSK